MSKVIKTITVALLGALTVISIVATFYWSAHKNGIAAICGTGAFVILAIALGRTVWKN